MPVATPDPVLGVHAKLAIGASAPTDKPLDFISESIGLIETFLDPQGLRGTRSHAANRVRAAGRIVSGDIVLDSPTVAEWASIAPYITGGAAASSGTGNNYPLTETLPAFYTDILRGDTLFRASGCRVNRADIRSAKGRALGVTLNVIGIDETRPGGAFPTLTLDTGQFLIHEDSNLGVIINSVTIDCWSLAVTVDNFVQARMVNSQVATAVYTTDRVVTWTIEVPWGDDETLYGLAQGGVPVSATFTNGNASLSLTSPKVQFPKRSPNVSGRDEIRNVLTGVARFGTAANDELVLFCDHSA